jgi:hypothetical protein
MSTHRIPWKHALRDLAVIATTVAVWLIDDRLRVEAAGASSLLVALLAGVTTA